MCVMRRVFFYLGGSVFLASLSRNLCAYMHIFFVYTCSLYIRTCMCVLAGGLGKNCLGKDFVSVQ